MAKPTASLSLDLDNLWSYLKVHGDSEWEAYPTYLPRFVPIAIDFFKARKQKLTFFVVGKDATVQANAEPLRMLAEAGHEIANHSFHHEPWMQNHSEQEVVNELSEAQDAIFQVTGQRPRGFRGPGYCRSENILRALDRLGYDYDASMLPSILGPIARLYYFATAKSMSNDEKKTRADLFGHLSDGFRPLKPFAWKMPSGEIIEIPVTTVPVFRLPFHLSYLIWLSRYSKSLSQAYLHFALMMCRLRGVEPSYLLHPLDFIGREDAPQLAFFPGMNLKREEKLDIAGKFLDAYQKNFDVVPMGEHVRRIRARGYLKAVAPALVAE